jgi:hypothetical protein
LVIAYADRPVLRRIGGRGPAGVERLRDPESEIAHRRLRILNSEEEVLVISFIVGPIVAAIDHVDCRSVD